MGWAIAIGIALLALLALWRSGRCSRLALEILAAALLVGVVGYGWSGSPDMPGNPVAGTATGQ